MIKITAKLDHDNGEVLTWVNLTEQEYAQVLDDQKEGNDTAIADIVSDITGWCVLSIVKIETNLKGN